MWSDAEIFQAIQDFARREGRPPEQHEFRNDYGLPGYGTVWRRVGSVKRATTEALSH